MCIEKLVIALGCAALPVMAASAATFDFETGDLQGWRVVSGAFQRPVTDLAKEHNTGKPYTKGGKYFLSTLETRENRPDDRQKGVIESPLVRLTGPKVSFKIGGGRSASVSLVDRATGNIYASAVGANGEAMRTETWNVPQAVGKDVFFRVTDEVVGSWCHLTLDDVVFEGAIGKGDFDARAKERALVRDAVRTEEFASVESAIRELRDRFPDYPAARLLKELEAIKTCGDPQMFKVSRASEDLKDLTLQVAFARRAMDALRQRALVRENPLVNAHEIAFVTRDQWSQDHHNTATIFQCGEINQNSYRTQGALKAFNPRTGAVRVIVPEQAGRTVRDPEVDYDGRRIVFSMRVGKGDDYHVYTVNADGSGLAQLTRAKGVSDIDPVWLPDGDILFSSTRNPKYCMCNRHIMANLFRMKPDGANIHQLGVSTLFEGHSSVLPDGRILYDRWEYVDRNFGDAQGLWVCNPDGTRHAIYWGNNTTSPGGVINARAIDPDDASKVITVFGSCHDRPWGALGIIDRAKGVDGQDPVLRTWPASYRERIHAGGREDFDSTRGIAVKYADPFPIDAGHFLAVRMTGRGQEMGIVYLDLHGNEVPVYEEAPGCHSPVILRAAKKPVVQSEKRNFDAPSAPGRFYVQNVYVGTHMKDVKPGAVKALRIVESPEKRSWTGPQGWFGHGEEAPAMNWHSFENKRILGTVPVEEDGSAYFEVPANTFVYFQALDGEGKLVQSMRSGAYVQPGETYGCVGCHENRVGEAAPVTKKPIAMQRAPSKLDGAYNLAGLEKGTPPHFYSFQKEVQPVFTKHCVKCHDYLTCDGEGAAATPRQRASEKLNLSGDRGAFFCASYVDLWALGAISCVGGGPASIQPAYGWGSHASKLTKKLDGHGGVKLSDEERGRIITWMDINAPYYPRYECAYPDNPGGRMPLTFDERRKLEELCGAKIANSHGARQREQLDFDHPECSRILNSVRPGVAAAPSPSQKARYDAALALIRAGAARLAQTPRCDMDGFVPCPKDQEREARYQRRLAAERRIYEAIRGNFKVYDK